ncbi:MAG: TonB-dependent receptor [Sulfuritalea sp.]|nr:TonB-dependent receptor [Sulfuritalea sp.]
MTCREGFLPYLLAVLAGFSGETLARDDPPQLEQLLEMRIDSAAKRPQTPAEAPSMISAITAKEIRNFGWRTLAEALGSLRGLHVSYDRSYTYLGVRGFGRPGDFTSRVLLLIDGVPVNDGVYDQAPVGTDFPLDLSLVERIEYVPGAGSVLYGGNALLAVVNVVTLSGARAGKSFQVGAGSGRAGDLSVSAGWRDESGNDTLLALARERRRGRDLFFDSYDAPGANAWSRGLDHEANDRFFAQFRRGGFSGSVLLHDRVKGMPGGPFGVDLDDPRNRARDRRSQGSLRYEHQFSAATAMRLQGYAMEVRYDGDWVTNGVVEPEAMVTRSLGGEVNLTTTALPGQTVLAGISWREDGARRQFTPTLDIDTPRTAVGIFAQDDIAFGERVTLSAGLRYDRITGGATHSHLSPRLALIVQPQPGTVVKAIAGGAFRPPNAFETDYAFAGFNVANPALRSERIHTAELGLEQDFSAETKLMAALYRNRIDDLISIETDPATGLQQHRNVGRVDAHGLEFEAQTRLGEISLRGSLAWQRVRHESGAEIANAPRQLAKLLLAAPLAGGLRLGWETHYTGSRKTDTGLVSSTGDDVGGHAVSHATLSGDFGRGVEWQLRLRNVFDRRYGNVAGTEFNTNFPGVQVSPMTQVLQDGRSLYGSLRWRFR